MKSIITIGIVALTAVAANDASAQSSETWRLSQVDGAALPAVVEQDDEGCREEVLSGTLTLEADGRWKLETVERETCGNEVEEETEDEDGRYTVQDGAIRFGDDDGDVETDGNDIDDVARGERTATTLTVRTGDDSRVLLFTR